MRRLALGPLGVRSFRLLTGGQFTSTIGDYCYAVALPWLVLSNRVGPALFFPIAGAVLAASVLGGLTQREFREFGAREEVPAADTTARSGEMKKAAT
jgi:hypothetical protein